MNDKTKSRIADIKALAKELDAEHYYGIERVKNRFNIDISYDPKGISNSNVIVGNREGYEYCFIEYYQMRKSCGWKSKIYLRMKNNIPDFELMTKEASICHLIFLGVFTFISTVIPMIIFVILFLHEKKWDLNVIIVVGVLLIFGVIGLILLKDCIKAFIQICNQNKYRILNKEFKDKYVIFSDAPSESIRTIFNEKVCSKIVKKPSDLHIDLKNNCISSDFAFREKLSLDSCNKNLNLLIEKVKLFENDDLN